MSLALHPNITGTVGLWQMQGDLLDSSGLGHDLSVEVSGTGAFAALSNLQGYKFRDITANASSSLIVTTATSDLRLTGDFTIEMLYQPISSPAGVSCFASCADTVGGPYYIWYANSGTQTYGDKAAGLSSFGTTVGSFGTTQHWALKKVGTLSKLYVNGKQVGSNVGATNPLTWGGAEPFRIGKQITFAALLDGIMASVRVLNYARTDADILADAQQTIGNNAAMTFGASASIGSGGTAAMTFSARAAFGAAGAASMSFGARAQAGSQGAAGMTFAASATATIPPVTLAYRSLLARFRNAN